MKLDWETLREAFDGASPEGVNWHLDRDTGEAYFVIIEDMDEEGEEEIEEMLDQLHPHQIDIDPPTSDDTFRWMEEYAQAVPDSKLRAALLAALGRSRPFRGFKDALLQYPKEREAWFEFEKGKINEAVEEWVEDADLHPENPPPWKK